MGGIVFFILAISIAVWFIAILFGDPARVRSQGPNAVNTMVRQRHLTPTELDVLTNGLAKQIRSALARQQYTVGHRVGITYTIIVSEDALCNIPHSLTVV